MHGPMEKDEVCLHSYLSGLVWMSCFLEHVFPRIRMNARAFSRVSRSLAV